MSRRSTWLTERFGLDVAVVGAPMAGVAGGRLAAAISEAGGLGMVGIGSSATDEWVDRECGLAGGPGRPYGAGFMAWALEQNAAPLAAVLAHRPVLVSISYGRYQRFLDDVRAAGAVTATQVGTLAEARAAVDAGVDLIVARGAEGGGHGRNDVGTLTLLQLVLDAVEVPVLAAGGIGTARGMSAVLAAGAAGAWVGTAFLSCTEAATSPDARARLTAATETDTVYGRVFDVGQRLPWPPEYGGRALRNAYFDRWSGHEAELANDDDASRQLVAARQTGEFDVAPIYAGQGVALLSGEPSAADVVAALGRGGA